MRRIALAVLGALLAIGAIASGASAGTSRTAARTPDDPVWATLLVAREATAKYHDVKQATKDGYHPVSACVLAPDGSGAMGIHYLNDAYAKDPAILAAKPELLLYMPQTDGSLKLVAVEYWRPDADQDLTTDSDRPILAGVPFNGPMEGHDPGMPRHYDLHVWVWAWNPAGVFEQFNPRFHC